MGVDARGRYDLPRIADSIAEVQPQLVGVQEISRNHAVYNCDDQPALIAARLTRITGRTWHHVYVKEWDTRKRECVDGGRGDEHETEGLAFFAPAPLMSVEHVRLWNSRLGLSARVAAAPDVDIVVTHLSSSTANVKDRTRQVEKLLPWAAARGDTRVLMGDLNADADAPELAPLFASYRDAWADAASQAKAFGIRSGSTRPGAESRIDFVLHTGVGLTLDSVEVVNTSGLLGTEASDHRPVVATFRIATRTLFPRAALR